MPRQVRIEFEDATYHVMCRGGRGEAMFDDDTDREIFLATLGEVCQKTGWKISAYVLMGNHYHLLLSTPEPNLVAGMTWIQGTYTSRYNARHRKSGHLFGGSVDMSDDKAVIGASPGYQGQVYMYDLSTDNVGWDPQSKVCFDGCHP